MVALAIIAIRDNHNRFPLHVGLSRTLPGCSSSISGPPIARDPGFVRLNQRSPSQALPSQPSGTAKLWLTAIRHRAGGVPESKPQKPLTRSNRYFSCTRLK